MADTRYIGIPLEGETSSDKYYQELVEYLFQRYGKSLGYNEIADMEKALSMQGFTLSEKATRKDIARAYEIISHGRGKGKSHNSAANARGLEERDQPGHPRTKRGSKSIAKGNMIKRYG